VNAAILAALDGAEPNVRVALLGVLAARNAKEALPQVLASAGDAEPAVRLAALEALRFLADESNTAAIVKILKAARDDVQGSKAELALLAVCSRGRQKCAEAIIAGLEDADVPSRMALLRALARAGGSQAMETVVGCLNDEDEAVGDEAVRMLSAWPDPSAAGHLREIAKTSESLRHQVLAIRGLVRLASPQEDRPADLALLAEVMGVAKRPEEKRLALGVLGGVATAESLALVVPALDDPAVADEAALAAVMIAETMKERPKEAVQAAMEQVLESVKSRRIGARAQKVLDSL
jgi:HEAT repeat protein